MYYEITKNEYKKHEKEFNKTYIGQQLFNAKVVEQIFGTLLWGIAGGIIGWNSVDSFYVSLTTFSFFFLGGIALLVSVLWHIEYRRELKKYIIEKSK